MKGKKKEKRRRGSAKPSSEVSVGIAWYSQEQWEKVREVAQDPENLTETYEEWLSLVADHIRELRRNGYSPEKVEIDVEALQVWCEVHGFEIDGEARSRFTGILMQGRPSGPS